MDRALDLARRGWSRVAPNPLVGAVVVRRGEIVGEGYHAEWGGPHAEVVALGAAGPKARGGELYVNLEPCRHSGKTGPCTEAILAAGIERVIYAVEDPDRGAGGGAAWLKEHGIRVDRGVCEEKAREENAIHLTACSRGRPFVALKYAMSMDGRLSEGPGEPTSVTSKAAVKEAHRLRAGYDCILVGIGTVLADDPQLTVREWSDPRIPPARAVVDSSLRLPSDSKLATGAMEVPLLVFAGADASEQKAGELSSRGADVIRVSVDVERGGLELEAVLSELWARGIRSVLCEGGGKLGSSLLAQGLVDRVYAFIAPRFFGEPGVIAFQGSRGEALRDWRLIDRKELGPDTLLVLGGGCPGLTD